MSSQSAKTAYVKLKDLNLDSRNPRFGIEKGQRGNQADILDFIVENFGVEDVISSLAYNGYFAAEPLIARRESDGTLTVVEGNRRLSACLMLANSDRAKNQRRRAQEYVDTKNINWTEETEVPVHIVDHKDKEALRLHAYLGVRHIMSAKAWDSYAKAAWIDEVVSSGEMTLAEIGQVTGDKNRTIQRLLEGYHFVNQLIAEGLFLPGNSLKKGRGSNPDFPFSWVYTLLDYSPVREWLDLEGNDPTNKKPIKPGKTADSASLVSYMFGDKNRNRIAAIKDSRQLGLLANAISDPVKREYLEQGATIEQIEEMSRAPADKLARALTAAQASLSAALSIASSGGGISGGELTSLVAKSKEVASLSASLFKKLRDMDEPESF
ncbi:hypothetical protein ACM7US_01175 [Pseudomonas aeruginosa]|uniref:hypothetical protein n=1 Tax=Pseudomonas aeruginosa TaxID=287 RepID=UPI0010456436|nr:hypothetical protein [Pseudomonas aeruginosa]MCO1978744.1 hypothetical protein [Pseudomonas aeruginosa]HEJ4180211.1 hypothetical protein [Pseudomonas aeruginosa]